MSDVGERVGTVEWVLLANIVGAKLGRAYWRLANDGARRRTAWFLKPDRASRDSKTEKKIHSLRELPWQSPHRSPALEALKRRHHGLACAALVLRSSLLSRQLAETRRCVSVRRAFVCSHSSRSLRKAGFCLVCDPGPFISPARTSPFSFSSNIANETTSQCVLLS